MTRASFIGRRSLLTAIATGALGATACRDKSKPDRSGKRAIQPTFVTVSQEQQATWVRNFNPLMVPDSVRWPTPAGIYEPLVIFNAMKGEYVPWLATKHAFSHENQQLTFTIRAGVKWSDGKPFGPSDVAFTFQLLEKHPALDLYKIWDYLKSVRAEGDRVVFDYQRVYVPSLFRIGQQPIVPEHVWKDVPDPVKFMNEKPVATGPFTEIVTFSNQVYELGRNPNYWQAGKPKVPGLRFPAFPNNDQANLALVNGEVDWSGKFVPDIERVFVAKDPAHHRYWFPRMGGMVSLFANLTRPPFDDVRVRKALSMAVNREEIVKLAMYGYTRPADATGLSDAFQGWRDTQAAAAKWTEFDVKAAGTLLDEAGFKLAESGWRAGPDGKPLEFEINVVNGWSDWVRAVQMIAKGFEVIGVKAKLRAFDYSAWFEQLLQGKFQMSIGSAKEGPTPYEFYSFLMNGKSYKPPGQSAPSNWQRFKSEKADRLFADFERTSDPEQQRQLATQMQRLFSEEAPVIPLFPSPSWGICSTKRFSGFPSAEDPYARLSPYVAPEYLLVLLNLEPAGDT